MISGLVTEFVGHPREREWHRAYVDARNSVQNAKGVDIYDVSDTPSALVGNSEFRVTLLMRVVRATEVNRRAIRKELDNDRDRQLADGQLTLAISVFGQDAEESADALLEYIGHPPPGQVRWIEAVSNVDGLRRVLAEWLLLVIEMRFHSLNAASGSLGGAEEVLSEEMPLTADGAEANSSRRIWGIP